MSALVRQTLEQCVSLSGLHDLSALRAGICRTMGTLFGARATMLLGFDPTGQTCAALDAWPRGGMLPTFDLAILEREAHPLSAVLLAQVPVVEGAGYAAPLATVRADLFAQEPTGRLVVIPGLRSGHSSPSLVFFALGSMDMEIPGELLEIAALFARFGAEACHTASLLQRSMGDNVFLSRSLETADHDRQTMSRTLPKALSANLVGSSRVMHDLRKAIAKYGPSELSVLVLGETGTGKELVARELHRLSGRGHKPFVAINMAALPENLAEAELFGHAKGAFTGAVRSRAGHFQTAHGGTLFFDEIGDIPLALQAKLLRVLQEKKFYPVGSDTQLSSDFRLIAATHRDIRAMVREGSFREDLYYRLANGKIMLPALRDRGDDVIELAQHFLDGQASRDRVQKRTLNDEAREILRDFSFPGNVRELDGLMGALWLESWGCDQIRREHFSVASEAPFPVAPADGGLKEACDAFERTLLERALREARGNRGKLLERLKISRRTLFDKLRKYELEGYEDEGVAV